MHNSKTLRELIRLVTITSSSVCSQSTNVENINKQSKIINAIKSALIIDSSDFGVDATQVEDDWS